MVQVTPPVPTPLANMGQPIPRYGALEKVTGAPVYAADEAVPNPLHAFFLTSGIAKGRIASINTAPAERVQGVVKVYTYRNAPKRQNLKHMKQGGRIADTNLFLSDADVVNDGDPVALVVADSYEAARDGAARIEVRYAEQQPTATFDSKGTKQVHPEDLKKNEKTTGDFDRAFAAAAIKIDHEYGTPTQHHNPMELFSTTAVWNGDELTIYEPSQFMYAIPGAVAEQLGIEQSQVRAVSRYVGGAFGSKGIPTQRTALIAAVARELGRPVKLIVHRKQGYTLATYRAETKHHIRMGAGRDGKLIAYGHEGWEVTSRQDDYSVAGVETTAEMYGWSNVWTRVNLVKADRNTPGFMRSPPETPYMYALESAMDEMAIACGMDPVEFRRINDTHKSPISGAPYTSRSLMQCFDQAAASFGWSRRTPAPMSMRDGDWQIGYGCATATYPTNSSAATARIRLSANGKAHVELAGHDLGTGAYTVMQQIAANALKLSPDNVTVRMGDSRLPPAPVAGGSQTTASAGSAVHKAATQIAQRFGGTMPSPTELAAAFERIGAGQIEEYAEWWPKGSSAKAVQSLYQGRSGGGEAAEQSEGSDPKPLMYAFGAEFVEVRVHRLTREIRVPRMTGAFAAGHIINPRTARSQYLGGMIWGMASALLEHTEIDRLRARYVNDNIAEYLIAVNADVPRVDILMVPEVDDQVNPIGVKGIGELGNVGTAAAVANAVYHATGKRIRELPITMDKLIV